MHKLHKSERGVSGSQGPTSYPYPHPFATTTRLPPHNSHHSTIYHCHQPPCQISTIRPGAPRTTAITHSPRASLSTAIASSPKPSTLNHTDKLLPPYQCTCFDITLILPSCWLVLSLWRLWSSLPKYSYYKPKISSILNASCSVCHIWYGIAYQVKLLADN